MKENYTFNDNEYLPVKKKDVINKFNQLDKKEYKLTSSIKLTIILVSIKSFVMGASIMLFIMKRINTLTFSLFTCLFVGLIMFQIINTLQYIHAVINKSILIERLEFFELFGDTASEHGRKE